MSRLRCRCLLVLCCCLPAGLVSAAEPPRRPTPQEIDFVEKKVRPLLLEQCGKCHGAKKQQGGLRLDSRTALFKGGDSGPVVKPGDVAGSLLLQAVRHSGALKMPPKTPLGPAAVATLEVWVRMGAPWPEDRPASLDVVRAEPWKRHWAFQPVARPALPEVKNAGWARTSIDRFILARLEQQGLAPSAPADRRTLLRRATFDLIGLPPTPEEVEAFVNDPAPQVFEKVVDRLLASPHYGERWGRHWLDVARYADTKGYVFFEEQKYPWAWTYRDHVIRAFNEDQPYDQLILQQLAGDQLPLGSDRRALTAMGFLTVGDHFMSNPFDIVDDRIDVVTRGLLGLTVSCARCHDHKFDPIPTRDYYSLYGVFASSVEPAEPPLFTEPSATPLYAGFVKELTTRQTKLTEFVRTKQNQVLSAARTRAAEYLVAAHALKDRPAEDDFMLLADGGDLNPTMLIRWRAYLNRTAKISHPVWSLWHALAGLPDTDFAARAASLLADPAGPARPFNPRLLQALRERRPANLKEAAQRISELLNDAEKEWQRLLAQAVEAKQPPPLALPDPAQEELRRVFLEPDAPANVNLALFSDLALLPDRPAQGEYQKLRKAVEEWRATGAGAPPRAMVLVDATVPYQPHVFLRGNPNQLGEAVPRQFLGVLAGPERKPFRQGSGRLELARAIADPKNPLTARVLVNRVWGWHFGAGLVRTPSDFGLRSEPPSHPELLDFLAASFVEDGWSIKKLHRRILLSAVYQQQSQGHAEGPQRAQRAHPLKTKPPAAPQPRSGEDSGAAVDPENLLLWKMNRRRLDFESLRDSLLAVSGRLDRALGGPSVQDTLTPAGRRRTLYGFVDRLQVPGLYRTFDYPSPDASSPGRDATTIPQQALFLLNNPFLIECARALLQRPEVAGEKDPAGKVARLYRLLYGRPAHADELALARSFLAEAGNAASAWERYTQALLLTNEFVFVD